MKCHIQISRKTKNIINNQTNNQSQNMASDQGLCTDRYSFSSFYTYRDTYQQVVEWLVYFFHKSGQDNGKPFYYLLYKSDIRFNLSNILYNIYLIYFIRYHVYMVSYVSI